jgi:uncharacterized pyridoxamine 5'-phosphate oxidase family protein
MNKAVEFLKKCGTFYLATVEGDQPRVRPFGAVVEMKGKVYICTNNKKECFKQIKKNPKVELCGTLPSGDSWIRVSGTLAVDDSLEARATFLKEYPIGFYKPDDGLFEVLYFVEGSATIASFGGAPESFSLYE